MHKNTILENIDKIHTTEMGVERIQRNLGIDEDPVAYCISKIKKDDSKVSKKGKNYYIEIDDYQFKQFYNNYCPQNLILKKK